MAYEVKEGIIYYKTIINKEQLESEKQQLQKNIDSLTERINEIDSIISQVE